MVHSPVPRGPKQPSDKSGVHVYQKSAESSNICSSYKRLQLCTCINNTTIMCLIRVCEICGTRRTCPTNFENVRRRSLISLDKMSSEKFDIRQTYHSETSGENSKCPAKDSRFARQNVWRGSNEFRILWFNVNIN